MLYFDKALDLRLLCEKLEATNKLFIDLEKSENRDIFNASSLDSIIQSLEIEGVDFDYAYIFLGDITN